MSLINPGLLPFLALAGIPIIIYLINRQRYRRIEWAAMDFLQRAMRKNRKRLRVENLLLLIIRTLIVLLFVLGMLRPLFDQGSLPSLGGTTRRAELLVVDASYSMGLNSGGRSLFYHAIDSAKRRIEKLNSGDLVGLFRAGGFPDSMFASPRIVNTESGFSEITEPLTRMDLVYESLKVAQTIEVLTAWIEQNEEHSAGVPWVVHFYTDAQRRDWLSDDGSLRPEIQQALQKMEQQQIRLQLHPLGPEKWRNATVTQFESLSSLLAIDMPTRFLATVNNSSKETMAGLEVEFLVDGDVQASKTLSIEPHSEKQLSFPYVFRKTGAVRVQVTLRSDELEEDNSRYQVVEVLDAVRVLIVEGGEGEGFLQAALSAESLSVGGVRLTPYDVNTISRDRFEANSLTDIDVLILTNIEGFSESENEHLEHYLKNGGGLLVFMGERTNPNRFNEMSYRGGAGWFPYRLGASIVDDSRRSTANILIEQRDHPVLQYMASDPNASMDLVVVHGYWPPRGEVPSASILARLSDVGRTPILVEQRFGDGRVLVFASSSDRSWNNMPISAAYVIFLFEALPYLSGGAEQSRNLSIGEPFHRVLSAEDYAQRVFLFRPDGGGLPLNLEPREDQKSFDLRVPAQDRPGLYEVRYGQESVLKASSSGEVVSRWLSVNADPAEGQLKRVSPYELSDVYPQIIIENSTAENPAEALSTLGSGEIWRNIFYAVLALLAIESLLARAFTTRSHARVNNAIAAAR